MLTVTRVRGTKHERASADALWICRPSACPPQFYALRHSPVFDHVLVIETGAPPPTAAWMFTARKLVSGARGKIRRVIMPQKEPPEHAAEVDGWRAMVVPLTPPRSATAYLTAGAGQPPRYPAECDILLW